jgi:hypothetical protein
VYGDAMVKKTNQSIENILNKNQSSGMLSSISRQFVHAQKAQGALNKFDIPYFKHTKVRYFNGSKLLLSTEIPELLAKFRELEVILLNLLQKTPIFCDLVSIRLQLYFQASQMRKNKSHCMSWNTKLRLETLRRVNKNKALSVAVEKVINHR